MQRFLPFFIMMLLAGTAVAQGYSETYDPACECTRVKNHFDNGQLSNTFTTVNGKKEGEEKIYYQNGKLQTVRHWSAGKLNGDGTHYHRNGNVHYNESYEMGTKTGLWEFKDENGDAILAIDYTSKDESIFTYYSGGTAYLTQTLTKGKMTSVEILDETLYQAKLDEAEASAAQKK